MHLYKPGTELTEEISLLVNILTMYCHNHAELCCVLGPSLRWALGGAWFAPATAPTPHRYSLRRPYRSCRSNQSSPDRLTFLSGKSALYMILRIVLQVSLTTPFSSRVYLPRLLLLRPGILVPALLILDILVSHYQQPACSPHR